jgi:hypothetical protein
MNEKDESVIPEGFYCYTPDGPLPGGGGIKIKLCPYWSFREDKPEQENGYCSFMGVGDWEQNGPSLLWDQVKECGIKMGSWEDEVVKDIDIAG